MNKLLFIKLCIVTLMANVALAMNLPQQLVFIKNDTKWKLKVTYTLTSKNGMLEKTLNPDEITPLAQATTIASLFIEPYGQAFGWFSKSALTGSMVKPENLAFKIQQKLTREHEGRNIIITVSLPHGIFGSLSSFDFNLRFEGKDEKQRSILPEQRFLFEAFPGVKHALNSQNEVQARNVLNLPAGASLASIEHAYLELSEQWSRQLHLAQAENRVLDSKFISDILAYLNEAYTALKAEALFQDYTFNKIYHASSYPQDKL